MIFDFSRRLKRPLPPLPPAAAPGDVAYGMSESGQLILRPRGSTRVASHQVAMGASGSGKSVREADYLCRMMVYEWLSVPPAQQASLVVIDPKGDLVQHLLDAICATHPQALRSGLVGYCNPFARHELGEPGGIPLNFAKAELSGIPESVVALQFSSMISAVSTGVGGQKHLSMGARQMDLTNMLLAACLACPIPECSLLWALDAIQGDMLKELAALTTSRRAAEFLRTADLGGELAASTSSRLRTALALYDGLENAVGARTCVSISSMVSAGRVTLIDLGPAPLPSLAECFGNILFSLLSAHLLARPSPSTAFPHCTCVLDEGHMLAEALENTALFWTTLGRSKNLSLTVLTQGTKLLAERSPQLLSSLQTNANIKSIARMSAPDAEQWVRDAASRPGVEESLSAVRSRLVGVVTNLADQEFLYLTAGSAVRAHSLPVDLAAWTAAGVAHAADVDAVKRRWTPPEGFPPRVQLADYLAAHKSTAARPARSGKPRSKWG